MLGLWEVGTVPQRLNLHLAFRTDLDDLLQAPAQLQTAGVIPRDFSFLGIRPTSRSCSLGCRLPLFISMTRTAICSSISRCCRNLQNPH
jgi:hypothetical protein